MKRRPPAAPRPPRGPAGELRIVAGQWRGRRIPVPALPGLRPTPDRVRETLFNWLAPRLPGSRCLDLFAGTGALGLEALSRGAAGCVFVESSPAAARCLRETLATLQADGASCQVAEALAWLGQAEELFDLVFLDPPFDSDLLAPALAVIDARGLLAAGGRVYVEAPAGQAIALPAGWELLRERRAGQVRFGLAGVKDREISRTIP
jgi:16S rRNA (guanine966-N2)-methyltransferase